MNEFTEYNAPESDLTTAASADKPRKIGWLGITLCVILLALNIVLSYSAALRAGMSQAGELVGYSIIGPIFMGMIVVGLFQLGKKFRNQKSRWTIFNWTLIVLLIVRIGEIVQMVGQGLPAS